MAKRVKKKESPGRVAGKVIRKQLRGVKSDLQDAKTQVAKGDKKLTSSLARSTRKLSGQNTAIQEELGKLREDLNKSRGKKPTRQLSMYNLFVRKQIEQGKSFEQATKSWKASRAVIENPELAKRKTRTITKTRTIIRRLPGKTIVRNVPVERIVVKRSPPRIKEVVRVEKVPRAVDSSLRGIMKELNALKTEVQSMESTPVPAKEVRSMSKPVLKMDGEGDHSLSNEEVAVRLTRLYFEEIARLGFKRRLDFDSIINAYYYCLQRLHNKDKELDVMRRIVEKEESTIQGESKSQLFPQGEQ
ncbi:MAG: hypothetical protein AABW68_01210 [archaeon]